MNRFVTTLTTATVGAKIGNRGLTHARLAKSGAETSWLSTPQKNWSVHHTAQTSVTYHGCVMCTRGSFESSFKSAARFEMLTLLNIQRLRIFIFISKKVRLFCFVLQRIIYNF